MMEKPDVIDASNLDPNFKYDISNQSGGENIKRCFQCGTCVASCPIWAIDERFNPRKIIRMALLGMKEEVLSSEFIWFCSRCYACYEQCPQDVRITELMGAIASIAEREGKEENIKIRSTKPIFDKAFVNSIRKYGRNFETETIINGVLATKGIKGLLSYVSDGLAMLRKRKLSLRPEKVKEMGQIKGIFEALEGK